MAVSQCVACTVHRTDLYGMQCLAGSAVPDDCDNKDDNDDNVVMVLYYLTSGIFLFAVNTPLLHPTGCCELVHMFCLMLSDFLISPQGK